MSRARPSFSQDLIWRLEAFGFDLLGWIFGLMPIETASSVGGALLRLIGPMSGADKTVRRNLQIAFPDLSPADHERLVAQQWDNVGRLTAEFQLMHKLTPAAGRVEIVGGEHLTAVAQSGLPAVLISGHFSNWEVMAAVIVHLGVRCDVTYRAANNPYIDARIIETRRRYGVQLMAPKGETGSREVIAAMKDGVSVALLNDQKFNKGIALPFFGVTAHTAPGPTRFALKYDCPMIPMCVVRTEGARFRVTIYPSIAPPDTGDKAGDIEQGVRNVNAFIEARVREHPEQWFWTHKRWPTEAYAALDEKGMSALGTNDPILVITTGGTIDKLYFDALSEYQVGASIVTRMLDLGRVKHPWRVVELMRKDSLELDDADRAAIAAAVAQAAESRIVITHGTDTMTITAKALAGVAGKTIVLTGALAPARFAESDASFNLGMAFATAQAASPGIYITMNGSVFPALEVVKDRDKGAFVDAKGA